VNISTRAGKETISGRKSCSAARISAANKLTHPAKAISLATGSDRALPAWVDAARRFCPLMTADRGGSVLPATLISGIRCHGLTISYSDYPLKRSGEASNGDLDEFQLSWGSGAKVFLFFGQYSLVIILSIHWLIARCGVFW
jgi:hypothetical protein